MTDPADDMDQRVLDALRLHLVPGIGPHLQRVLLEHFGDPGRVFASDTQQLQYVPGVGRKLAESIRSNSDDTAAREELNRCRELGIRLVLRDDDTFPQMLREVSDAPQVLYCRGELAVSDSLAIAIVGSRRCSVYGRQTAERLAAALARAGFTIVSGLARGIDAAAHRGALAAQGRTIAVMGTGVRDIYPPEHAELAVDVAQSGAVVSEFKLEQIPSPGLFPQRNRIISGMCVGVIIVEATANSGSLYTARHAMEQGRDVFAVPGRIDSLVSRGCHDLIRDGVTLIRGPDDVLDALGPLPHPVQRDRHDSVHSPRELTLNDQERAVLNLIPVDAVPVDEILRMTSIEASRVLATLTVLEMKRMVRRLPGNRIMRAAN